MNYIKVRRTASNGEKVVTVEQQFVFFRDSDKHVFNRVKLILDDMGSRCGKKEKVVAAVWRPTKYTYDLPEIGVMPG